MAEIAIAGAIAVLRQVVITLGKLVVHKGGSLYKLTEDLKWIENEMSYMRAYLGDADADDVQGGSSVEGGRSAEVTSPKNIRALAYDVEDVVETYFPHIASQKGKGCLGRRKIAKTARDFAGEIGPIRGRVEKINCVITINRRNKLTKEKIISSLDPRRSFPHIDEVNVVVLERLGVQEVDRLSNIFAPSYKDLPPKLKPCSLYFGLFPEHYEIPAFELINLWAAEGFIRQGGGVQEVEDVGEDYLNQLISKNFIQVPRRRFDGRIRSFRIPDIIHRLCAKEAMEIDFFNALNYVDRDSATRVRRVTTYNRSLREYISSSNYKTPKLHAVLCFNKEDESELTEEQIESFLKELRLLRVLRLEFQLLKISLPSEIGNLSHLSYLQLKVARGPTTLPSAIGNLRSLLTLDVRECPDGVIIPDCIWKMKELRHFLLSEKCEIEVIGSFSVKVLLSNVEKLLNPTKEAASSVNLKTLYGLNLKVSYCLLKYWFPKFTKLTKLGLSFKDGDLSKVKVLLDAGTLVSHQLEILRLDGLSREKRYNILDLNLYRYVNLSRLHLGGPIVELPECDKLPPNLTKLTLVNTNLLRDPMETLKELSKLKILKLGEESYLQEKMSAQGNNIFPQLEVLVIDKLNHLEEIQVMEGAMPQLTKIIIKGCGPRVRIPNRNPDIVTQDEKVESSSLR